MSKEKAEARAMTNAERQAAWLARLKAAGYARVPVVVHEDDRARLVAYGAMLRDEREAK